MPKGQSRIILSFLIVVLSACLVIATAEASSSWQYYVTGPDGSGEIPEDKVGQIVYFQFDSATPDYVWGNVRIDFDPALLECVSIEESPTTDGFWNAWIEQTVDPAYGGGGTLYYYDSTGHGSDWAQAWVGMYGPLNGGPSGSYDNSQGIIRLYAMTGAGGLNGSLPLRIGFRIKQAGAAMFTTHWNDGTAFSWRLEDLHFSKTSVVQIGPLACVNPPSGMVGWWPGDGNADDIANAHHGTLAGNAAFAPGKVASGFSLNGMGGYMIVPDSNAWDFGLNDFTMDLWVSFNQIKNSMFIHQQSDINIGGFEFDFQLNAGHQGTPLGPTLTFARDPYNHAIPRSWSPQTNTWYHLAVTRTNRVYRLYVNGVQLGSEQYDPNPVADVTGSVRVGSWSGGGYDVDGLIDEVEIFNRALSAQEIQAIYAAGSAGKCKNQHPTANAGLDQTVETTSCAGANVTLNGSGSSDPDGDALTYTWTENGSVIATGVSPTVTLSFGSHSITLTVDDGKGGTATDEVKIDVVDTSTPALNVSLNPKVLWPPNHKYVTVTPSIAVSDACMKTMSVVLLSASSNEPDNGLGDGDTANDIVINADGTISLRAERSGKGSGRVYTITYQATDATGNTTTISATVAVPHNR